MRLLLGILPLLCLTLAQDKPEFPEFYKAFQGGYQFKTELKTKENKIVHVDEYFNTDQDIGRLDMTINGDKESIFYNAAFQGCTRVKYADNFCVAEPLINFTLVAFNDFVMPAFAFDTNRYVLGPSAVFHMATRKKPVFANNDTVRGIDVNVFTFTYGFDDEAVVYIYFTLDTWTDAFTGKKGAFPIRIKIDGPVKLVSGRSEHVYQTFDITNLMPYVKEYNIFQVPTGIGCFNKERDILIPTLPDSFKLVAERHNVTKGELTHESNIDTYKLWYDEDLSIARLDSFNKDYLGSYEIVDYAKGIMYKFNKYGVCTIQSSFESFFSHFSPNNITPRLKTPKEIFYLDKGENYYIGKGRTRGIMCDIWETIATDYEFDDSVIPKVVHTYYFSAENWKEDTLENSKDRIPVRISTSYYSQKDLGDEEKVSYMIEATVDVNIYEFTEDLTYDIDKFNVQECYPADMERQLVEITFKTDLATEIQAELNNNILRNYLLLTFVEYFNITSLRVPYIDIDYELNKIIAKVLILEAPNVLDSFYSITDKMGTLVEPDQDTTLLDGTYDILPYCAKECLERKSCLQFYYCNSKQLCYIKEIAHTNFKVKQDIGCEWYTKSDMEVAGPEPLLKDFIQILTNSVLAAEFEVRILVKNDEISLIASEIKKIDSILDKY